MKRVQLIKNWQFPDLMRQSPDGNGVWSDIQVVQDAAEPCDYVLVLNHVARDTTVFCPREHVWCLTQEPPVPDYAWHRKGFRQFYRVYSQDTASGCRNVIPSPPAVPWWVGKTYRELKAARIPDKPRTLSWVMSNKSVRSGHVSRLAFLRHAQGRLSFDLWGWGFTPFEDKWHAIAPYRYSVALENHAADYYWTEKLSDVLLAWSLPIYYGAPNVTDFLPAEAIVQIDIEKPEEAIAAVQEAVRTNQWQKRLDAIAYARELILDRWQFFPYMKSLIDQFERQHSASHPRRHTLRATWQHTPSLIARLRRSLGKALSIASPNSP